MKFHYSNLKYQVKLFTLNIFKMLYLMLNVIMFYITVIVFWPVRLMSIGFIRKLTKPILDLQDELSSYCMANVFVMLYCFK